MSELAVIILAAGKGTRMKSDLHKVLHPIAGRPMLMHLMDSVDTLRPAHKVVVVGDKTDQLRDALRGCAAIAVQEPQLGTGHAVQQAEDALSGFEGDVLILYGDVPFVPVETMKAMRDRLNADDRPAVVVLAFDAFDPHHYGRVMTWDNGQITKMVEYKDASPEERDWTICNSGLMAVKARDLFPLLARVTAENAAKEYYLVDIVNIAIADGRMCAIVMTDEYDVQGINSREELAAAESGWQAARRIRAMAEGASLAAPETVWFSYDTKVGRDVTIGQNVVFGPGVTVADKVRIHAFSHIEGAMIGEGAEVGPYARLRPGAVLGEKSKVGNFVEVKKATFGEGAKANHLSYIGDADVGAGANIGAGTITCNYDGFFKYQTVIGEGAFVGSNSALVAPVTIGAGAIVGAGSVVTADVSADALALVRPEQREKTGWAKRFRDVMSLRKAQGKA
jgi:bifunctional UDP-N-acetylglucosamine pyrophosphorylase / glucosamine-1-phosphate N-acetyltransferase